MDASAFEAAVPRKGQWLCANITIYLARRGLYRYIAESFRKIVSRQSLVESFS